MTKELNFSGKLDFSEIDLTPPDKVIEEMLSQLPANTQNMVYGKVVAYVAPVTSYATKRKSLVATLSAIATDSDGLQENLGKIGEEVRRFECFLYTPIFKTYKYRMFFVKYGVANYPVQFTLEESIARSAFENNNQYVIECKNRGEVEELLVRILTSEKVLEVMQEIIRVYQSKKDDKTEGLDDVTNSVQ